MIALAFAGSQRLLLHDHVEVVPLRLRAMPTTFFHILQPSEQVLADVKMSKFSCVGWATLCLD
jgi:hypothetical protein